MKLAVYAIAKNEEKHVARWAASCADADYRVILDTGSTDDTVALAREHGVDVHEATFSPWRFDDARNAALELVPADADYCVTLDLDEVLLPGWRDAFEALAPEVTRPRFTYIYSRNSDGTEGLTYGAHATHHRHGYRWEGAIHESVVRTPGAGPEVQGWCDAVIEHMPDPGKSRGLYLDMLRDAANAEPLNPRHAFYLGRELMIHAEREEAATELTRYLAMMSPHTAERATAMRYLAAMDEDHREAHLLRACAETPERREPWADLAYHHYTREAWAECFAAATRALTITDRPLGWFCEAEAWGALPHDLAALSAHHLGMTAEAVTHGEAALAFARDDERLRRNLTFYREEVAA